MWKLFARTRSDSLNDSIDMVFIKCFDVDTRLLMTPLLPSLFVFRGHVEYHFVLMWECCMLLMGVRKRGRPTSDFKAQSRLEDLWGSLDRQRNPQGQDSQVQAQGASYASHWPFGVRVFSRSACWTSSLGGKIRGINAYRDAFQSAALHWQTS